METFSSKDIPQNGFWVSVLPGFLENCVQRISLQNVIKKKVLKTTIKLN